MCSLSVTISTQFFRPNKFGQDRMRQESRRDGRECLKCCPFSTALQKCFREKNSFELKMIRGVGEVEQLWSSCLEQLVRLFN